MLLLPHRLLDLPFVDVYWKENHSYILRKTLSESTGDRHGYLSTHAFSMVSKGEQRIVGYEGQLMRIQAGEIGFLPRGMYTITDLVAGEEGFETTLFFLDESLIKQVLSDTPNPSENQSTSGFWKTRTTPELQQFSEKLIQATQSQQEPFLQEHQPISQQVYVELQLVQLLWLMVGKQSNSSLLPHLFLSQKGQWRDLRLFMETHYDKPLTVEDFAYLTGRSLSTFHREFRQRFDTTPRQWIREKRLEKSYQLLAEDGATVTDTVFAVGYQHVSNFIKAFKKKYHLTPKQYVLQQRGKI